MFERFTSEARQTVVRAQEEARSLQHPWIGTEHLLLGVLGQPRAPGVAAVVRLGITREACRAAIQEVVGPGGGGLFGPDDAAALQTVGIDLDEVRRRVEDTFGPGALDLRSPEPCRSLPRIMRRRRRRDVQAGMPFLPPAVARAGHIPFMPRAKRALERALREALALHDRHVGVEHVLLGLLDPKGNLAVEILRRLGIESDAVRAAVLSDLGRAA